jgi:hypothetical protein
VLPERVQAILRSPVQLAALLAKAFEPWILMPYGVATLEADEPAF